ncbi:hypothetical protein HELRODRAFT_175568 [Helobdella robusta]|uniref:Uncharacterized protein n=1 Tax=Helobdella robusta TaxID=6412 RepID=T1F9D9_HELRO|nr:hypothetical protein HELRODRAFT_175568 [Helobdella robusta]ESO00599.1 hypothetical protein HELRODRAFT_175568 [Helobdella robusta]
MELALVTMYIIYIKICARASATRYKHIRIKFKTHRVRPSDNWRKTEIDHEELRYPKTVLRSALNFVSDGEEVREGGRDFQRIWPEKANADIARVFNPSYKEMRTRRRL